MKQYCADQFLLAIPPIGDQRATTRAAIVLAAPKKGQSSHTFYARETRAEGKP